MVQQGKVHTPEQMQELLLAVRRHECEVDLMGFEVGENGSLVALFEYEPCSRTCSLAFLFGSDIIFEPLQLS